MSAIKKLYKGLYNDTVDTVYRCNNTRVKLDELSHFVAMKGEKYGDSKVKLFVIGRAVNDWLQLPCDSADDFAEKAEQLFLSDHFDWIAKDGDRFSDLHNIPDKDGVAPYYLNISPFWRVTNLIWRKLTKSGDCRFIDYIAWSNLYKIAPRYSVDTAEKNFNGNPNVTMCKKQFAACKEILAAEIQEFKPTHILLITDYERWFADKDCDFSELFKPISKCGSNYEDKSTYVEGKAEYKLGKRTIPTVITCRPEGRKEALFAEAVVDAFKKMK